MEDFHSVENKSEQPRLDPFNARNKSTIKTTLSSRTKKIALEWTKLKCTNCSVKTFHMLSDKDKKQPRLFKNGQFINLIQCIDFKFMSQISYCSPLWLPSKKKSKPWECSSALGFRSWLMFIEIWTGQSRSKLDTEIATQKREQDSHGWVWWNRCTTTVQSSFSLARRRLFLPRTLAWKLVEVLSLITFKYMPNKHCSGFDDSIWRLYILTSLNSIIQFYCSVKIHW